MAETVLSIQEEALAQCKAFDRAKAVERAKQYIHQITEEQYRIKLAQERIEQIKRNLADIKVEEITL